VRARLDKHAGARAQLATEEATLGVRCGEAERVRGAVPADAWELEQDAGAVEKQMAEVRSGSRRSQQALKNREPLRLVIPCGPRSSCQ
jgi:hypothetical protein